MSITRSTIPTAACISAIRRSIATTSSRPPPPSTFRRRSRCGPTPTSPSARASSTTPSARATAGIRMRRAALFAGPQGPAVRRQRNAVRLACRHRAPGHARGRVLRPGGAQLPRAQCRRARRRCRRSASPTELRSQDPDLARRRSRHPRQRRAAHLADQRLLHGAAERAALQPGDLHQHQSRSDAPLRRREHRDLAGGRDACGSRPGSPIRASIFREGPFAGNDVPLVSPWTGSVGGVMGHLPEVSGARRGGAFLQRAPDGQRLRRISSR